LNRLRERRDNMAYRYVTIEREYGSGGTETAQIAAKLSGVPCYGAEIFDEVCRRAHCTPESLMEMEETVTNSFLYSLVRLGKLQSGDVGSLTGQEKLFFYEQKIISEMADRGPAIFIGHCADGALEDRQGVLRVFLFADEEFKHKRIREVYGVEPSVVDRNEKRYNRRRANYYEAYSMKKWNDRSNYDLILNTGTLGIETCAEIIAGRLGKKTLS
jgi:hypothetical protein